MSINKLWRKLIREDRDGQETEFLPAVLEVTETPPSPVGRLVLWSMVVLLIVAFLWSVFGKVDEVAVAGGKIIPVGQVKIVQSEDKGIVKDIYVKEGDFVKAGQILVELDTTRTKADLDQLKKQTAYYQMTLTRLNAEIAGNPFEPTLTADLLKEDVTAQKALYDSRRSQLSLQLSRIDMTIDQAQADLQASYAQQAKLKVQLEIARDMESRIEFLVKEDAVAVFQLLQYKATRVEYEQNLYAQDEAILKAKATLAEAKERRGSTIADYNKEVMTEMVEARKQYNGYVEELKKAEETNRLAKILAPVDGRVNQLSIHTVGGVVTEAQALMMIVPDDVTMEIEAWADNKDIGFIQVGQKAEIKVETFNFQKFGIVDGVITEISPDAISDSNDKEKHNKYRLTLKMESKDMLVGDKMVPLSPGMSVSSEIKIRQKRIIEFFLDPFRQYKSEALRER